MALTNIGDRLTPSIPIEIVFDAQSIAAGTKITSLVGRMAASGAVALPGGYHLVVNFGDADKAQAEVDALAGEGSEIGQMAYAFVAANSLVGRSNFPTFRVVFVANGQNNIDAALPTLRNLRSDMIVPFFDAASPQVTALIDLANQISGADRDLQGQFGSFVTVGYLGSISQVATLGRNSNKLIVASLPDTNTAELSITGDSTQGSPDITNLVGQDGVYPGADVTGAGVPVGTKVESVSNGKVTLTNPIDEDGTQVSFTVQNHVSQSAAVVACAHAGAMMASVFPYNPLKGTAIGGLIPPVKMSDRVQIDPQGSSEALLRYGVSPLYVQPGDVVAFIKTITTYHLQSDGVSAVRDYNAWQQLVTLNDFREELYLICQNPPFSSSKASLTIADALLGEMVRLAKSFEDQGAFQGVNSLAKEFVCQPSVLRRGRFDCRIPVNVLPDLDVIAIQILATTRFDFTL